MTDNRIEKIRAEIERLKHQSVIDSDRQAERGLQSASMASFGKVKACEELLSFIDSMQKEPKECMYSKDNYTDEDRKVLCDGCEEECIFNKKEESINNGLDLGCGVIWKDEEPVIEPQVKESTKIQHDNKTCKENDDSLTQEPVSDDLEAAIDTYLATYFGGEKEKQDWPFLKKMAIHFAAWQKQQMMKNAVKGGCFSYRNGYKHISCDIDEKLTDIKFGDKIKVIVIKEG